MMNEDLLKTLEDCFKLINENIEVLAKLELALEDEKEDELVPDLQLHQLFDMTEDVSVSSKIKRAEFNLVRRQSEESF